MKKIMLSPLVLTLSNLVFAQDRGAGTVFYTMNGKTEYVQTFREKDDKVTFVRCKGGEMTEERSKVEFFSQAEVCAKMTISAYGQLLEKVNAAITKKERSKILVTLPPEQNFREAAALTTQKLGNEVLILKGSNLKIQVYSDDRPMGSDFESKTQAIGPNVWTDRSGYIQFRPFTTKPKD